MRTIIGFITFLLIAVVALAYFYFSSQSQNSRSNDKVLAEIPGDASLVFQFQNDKSMYDIFRDYTLFDAVTGKSKATEIAWLRNALLANAELYEVTENQKIFLSFHPTKEDSVSFLWFMPVKGKFSLEEAETIIRLDKSNQITSSKTQNITIFEIKNPNIKRPFFISFEKNMVRGSFSKGLLLQSLDPSVSKLNREFIKNIIDGVIADDDALANVFINHTLKPGFLKTFYKGNMNGNFALFNSFPGYGSLKMNFKSDALMFNGITRLHKSNANYIKLFLNQKPVSNTLKKVLPLNTANAVSYGLSDYSGFHNELKTLFSKRKELKELEAKIQLVQTETGINPGRDMVKLWNNEYCTFQLSTWEDLAVIKLSNGSQLEFLLEPLSATYSETVRKMNYEDLFYYFFGDPFKKYSKPFYGISDNMIVISNSPSSVQRFLNDYDAKRLLSDSDSFKQFDQLVADQSNISFMLHFGNSASYLKNQLKREYSKTLNSDEFGFKNLYGISYQLISNEDEFFTNFYSGYKAGVIETDSLVYND